jgi:hypothetical protein
VLLNNIIIHTMAKSFEFEDLGDAEINVLDVLTPLYKVPGRGILLDSTAGSTQDKK